MRRAFVVALVCAASLLPSTASAQEPAFGDSSWVAPYPVATDSLLPDGTGPRVAERNGEALGETILRTPFRVVFFPLRVVARGLEWGAGLATPNVSAISLLSIPAGPFLIHPTADVSSAYGVAPGVIFERPDQKLPWPDEFGGSWSTLDARLAHASYTIGERGAQHSLTANGRYSFWPTRAFFGVGNDALPSDRAIYLHEEFLGALAYRLGRSPLRRAEVHVAYSDVSARTGYNDSPGALDLFDPSDIPFLLEGSEVLSLGLGGRWAVLDNPIDPSLGIDVHLRLDHVHSTDRTDLDYQNYSAEIRGYVPVFAPRRVFALRGLYASARPMEDSREVPFYRMPETDGTYRLAGFEGRQYRDRHLFVGRAEYRWLIATRVWMLGFAELGEVAPSIDAVRMNAVHESYGGGLRFAYSEAVSMRAELAQSRQGMTFRLDLRTDY